MDPSIMGKPTYASRKSLAKARLKVNGMDLWKINECIRVVAINTISG